MWHLNHAAIEADVDGMWMGCGWDVDGMWMGCGWDVDGMWMVDASITNTVVHLKWPVSAG